MKQLTILFISLAFIAACKKAPLKNYTIQGRIYISYPKMPFARQAITVTVTKGSNDSYQSQNLGYATTDDSGYFSVTYTETNITGTDPSGGPNAQIHINSQYLQFSGIPVNQNVNKDFYIPTKGQMQVYLQTNNPLEINHDTLFLAHASGNSFAIDTIFTTINGLYKTYTLPVEAFAIFYGRGSVQFHYDSKGHYFTDSRHSVIGTVEGDPIVDKMTINY